MIKKTLKLKTVTIVASTISLTLTIIFSWLFLFYTQYPVLSTPTIDPAIFGQLGDVIGGIVGTALGFLSVFLLYKTYRSQKKELKATQDAMYDQKNDSAIFNMLTSLRQIVSEMDGDVLTLNEQSGKTEQKTLKGRQYIHEVLKKIKRDFSYEHVEERLIYSPSTGRLHTYYQEPSGEFDEHGNEGVLNIPNSEDSYSIDMTRHDITIGFLRQIHPYSYNFDHYFRFFRNITEFIDLVDYELDKVRYFKMLSAQLSQDELVMIFYFVLASEDKFLKVIDSNKLLEPILNPKSLIDVWHHWHFPKTDFKFLWEQERIFKKEYRDKHS